MGSGTLVTFPVLIALGITPVTASISNAMGLVAGNAAGAWGYRRSLQAGGKQLLQLLPASLLGGISGAWLLLHLPEKVFHYAAPVLMVLALLMVVFQPRLQAWVRNREENPEHAIRDKRHGVLLIVLVYLAGVYGGYFVAAQGILLVGILGVFMTGTMQNANAMKNILVLGVNMVAAISYLIFAFDRINWLLWSSSSPSAPLIGGVVGSKVGRKLSPRGPPGRHLYPWPRGAGLHDRQPAEMTSPVTFHYLESADDPRVSDYTPLTDVHLRKVARARGRNVHRGILAGPPPRAGSRTPAPVLFPWRRNGWRTSATSLMQYPRRAGLHRQRRPA